MRYLTLAATLCSLRLAQAQCNGDSCAIQCLIEKSVPHKDPTHAEYAQLIIPFNTRLPYKPAVVVLPTTEQHVQDAVSCAAQTGLKVQARSGGHGYASHSIGGKDGSMNINLQGFQKIQLDKETGIAEVGGGVRLGNLAGGLWEDRRVLSHGTCPGVGIGGHFTHGGYSFTSRHYGLAMDQIIALDVVLANGTLIHATSTSHSEMYWALRGAADSFGIVTTFYLQTHPAPPSVVRFKYVFDGVYDSKDDFREIFLHLQDVAQNASVMDDKSSYEFYLDSNNTYSFSGIYFGTVDEYNSALAPELLRTLPPSNGTVKSVSWYDFLLEVSHKDTIKTTPGEYNLHANFFAKSIAVPETDPLAATALDALFDHLHTAGSIHWFIEIYLHGGPGSLINTKDTSFAAYTDRDNLWVMQNYGFGDESVDFVNGINQAVYNAMPQTRFGAYLNYVDPTYDAQTAHEIYFGEEVYGRLERIKAEVDPGMVFWHPQAIGVGA